MQKEFCYGQKSFFNIVVVRFFFSNKGSKDFNELFAKVNKYLLTFGLFIFLGIMFYLDIIKHFIDSTYWDGLKVVPYLLIGHLLVGMVYLQSFWYKLNSKTVYGIYIFVIGAVVTIALNYIFVPKFGYAACAVANVVCYLHVFMGTEISCLQIRF